MTRMTTNSSVDNVLDMVDPYNTGMYKGKYIGNQNDIHGLKTASADQMPIVESLSQGVSVGFKKRKRPTGNSGIKTSDM